MSVELDVRPYELHSLVCAVLLRRHMRSKTNSILVAMAVADTLTGTCPLPPHCTTTGKPVPQY